MAATSKNASKRSGKPSTKETVSFETMESRQMFSVVTVTGTGANDTIQITQGSNVTVKVNGQSKTYPSNSTFQVNCLGGNDTVVVAGTVTAQMSLNGGDGNDSLTDGNTGDAIDGGTGNDTISGNGGNDTIYGVDGNDVINGGEGDDLIFAGHGNDTVDGQGGNDYVSGNGQPNSSSPAALTATQLIAKTRAIVFSPAFFQLWTDNDVVRGGLGNDVVDGAEGNDAVYGGLGDDECWGGDGNDRVYGGGGNNRLIGGNGDDVLVSIGGGTSDLLWGQAGVDSFWMDDARSTELNMDGDPAEYAGSNFHFIKAFEALKVVNGGTTVDHRAESKELNGQNFIDPAAGNGYVSFSAMPLFASDGPKADDVRQGAANDCYFMSGLAAVAKANANTIRQTVVDLGDGTYGVRFFQNGLTKFYRVDGDLPASSGIATNAKLGHGNALWVAIVEKAFAFFRSNVGTYASINVGYLKEPFNALGLKSDYFFNSNGTKLLQSIQSYLSQGKAVTGLTPASGPTNGAPVIPFHVYMVDRVDLSAGTITVRNPYAVDGAGNDGNNDGYVTMSAAQFAGYFIECRWSNVA